MAEGGDEDITVTKLKLKSGDHVYVKTRWIEDESFCITVLNGSLAWSYHMSEENVAEIASAWGISVEEFMETAGTHLRIQDPTSTYSFRVLDSNWMRALVCLPKNPLPSNISVAFFSQCASCCCQPLQIENAS